MMTTAEKFKELAEQYGFEADQNDIMVSLCARNTDGEWTPWIRYNYYIEEVLICGETDYLNIWLGETRPDMTPEKCVAFVDELNKIFDFQGCDKILVRDLIDPEDWQEIADIPDASEDERFGKLIGIGGHCCIQVDTWRTDGNTFVLGMNFSDRSFFHASVNGKEFFEYDEGPTREKVESDYADRLAERQINRHEAEFGADGSRAFPQLNDDVSAKGSESTYTVTDYFGAKIELALRVELYEVEDFMGETLPGLAIVMDQVNTPDGERDQYGVLTVSFGEFIGMKNVAYIDTNNNPFAEQLLQYGFAEPTGLHKNSGFCAYPLWQFNEEFLKAIGGERYKEYSDAYDKYMGMFQDNENWELVSRKEVPDADGFMTEYSWYTDGDVHIFVLGDSEIYSPESAEPDWECDNEEEAREWFDGYKGVVQGEEIEDAWEGAVPEDLDIEDSVEDLSGGLSLDGRIRAAREKSGGKPGGDLSQERDGHEK